MATGLSIGRAGALAVIGGALCTLLAAAPARAVCVGDCNDNCEVVVSNMIVGVNIVLGNAQPSACPAFQNAGGNVDVAQLVKGVNNLLNGCNPASCGGVPTETPTSGEVATATPTETPTGAPTETATPAEAGLCDLKPGTCVGGPNAGTDCTATAQCGTGGRCDTTGNISKIELNVAALPVPLSFPIRGQIKLDRGAITNDQADMACIIRQIDPINIPSIGFVCITAATTPCTPPGTIACAGGAKLGIDLLSDGNIGACEGNAACVTACDTFCTNAGGVQQTSGCTGFCSGSTPQACTTDAGCTATTNGACNGPDPVGSVANICQCQCTNTAAGEASDAGDFQCQLGSSLVVESAAPCNGTDVSIAVGDACIPVTTETAGSLITNANFNPTGCPGGGPPCNVPTGGPILNTGSPVACNQYEAGGSLSGLTGVGVVNFFGSALGDIATELFAVCK